MEISVGNWITIATVAVGVITWAVRSSETARRSREDGEKLRADLVGEVSKLRGEITPVVALAQESLRQSTAAFKAVDELRAQQGAMKELWARLDERVRGDEVMKWARSTDRFRPPPEGE